MLREFARFAARTFFRDIVVDGAENLPEQGPVIFTPNHPNGLLDPMLLFFLPSRFRLRFVAKATLFKIPVFGSILRSIGSIPVVRKFEAGGEVDYTAFFASCVQALAEGDCIVIFPEGRSLPQSYLAPLKTGPARLFLMAREKGIPVKIVSIGLNYEKGETFRSRVLMRIAPPLQEPDLSGLELSDAVRQLTEKLTDSLEDNVIQAQSYRERELMTLLETLSAQDDPDQAEFMRFTRLKEFERGLSRLRVSAANEIDSLRELLSRYDRLSREYGIETDFRSGLSFRKITSAILGALLAIPGWIFNFIPYHVCDLLIKASGRDAADAATFKVIYSLFLFPISYALEGYFINRLLGPGYAILFSLLILPFSYFTLIYMEWYESQLGGVFWPRNRQRMRAQLERLRDRILEQLEKIRTL